MGDASFIFYVGYWQMVIGEPVDGDCRICGVDKAMVTPLIEKVTPLPTCLKIRNRCRFGSARITGLDGGSVCQYRSWTTGS